MSFRGLFRAGMKTNPWRESKRKPTLSASTVMASGQIQGRELRERTGRGATPFFVSLKSPLSFLDLQIID